MAPGKADAGISLLSPEERAEEGGYSRNESVAPDAPSSAIGRLQLTSLVLVAVTALFLVIAKSTEVAGPPGWPDQLSDWSTCQRLVGVDSLTPFQVALPLTGGRYGVSSTSSVFLPAFSSWPLNKANSSITSVVIFQHGSSGAANSYYCAGLSSVLLSGAVVDPKSVLVIAPWFGSVGVTAASWVNAASGNDSSSLFWGAGGWQNGAVNSAGAVPSGFTTSFDVVDQLLDALAGGAFPALKQVSVVGFGDGGQMVNTYALARGQVNATAGTALKVALKLVVGDPNSYVYLDNTRPVEDCRPLIDSGVAAVCNSTQFQIPLGWEQSCPAYNAFPYGLDFTKASRCVSYLAGSCCCPSTHLIVSSFTHPRPPHPAVPSARTWRPSQAPR